MKLRKILGLCLAGLLSAGIVSGCGFVREKSNWDKVMPDIVSKVDFDADASFTGKLRIARNMESGEIKNLNAFVDTFKVKYPNIEVTVEEIPSAIYSKTVLNRDSAASNSKDYSNMYDIFWLDENSMPTYADREMLMPINYFDEADKNFTTDGLVENMVKECSHDGNMFMMPRDYNQLVLYYNKTILDDMGIAAPSATEAMTNAEFLTLLASVRDKASAAGKPWGLDAYWNWEPLIWSYLKSFGGQVIETKDGKPNCVLTSDTNFNAFKLLKEMNIENLMPGAGNSALGLFGMGEAAFGIHSRATLTSLLDENVVTELGVAPLPQFGPTYTVGSGCSGYGMYRNAPHTTEAWLFLRNIVSSEGQTAFGATGNGIPVLNSELDDSDASWRKYTHKNLISGFDHNAYVYQADTAACSTRDYKDLLSMKQIPNVKTKFEESAMNILNYTNKDNYLGESRGIAYYLSIAEKTINKELLQVS